MIAKDEGRFQCMLPWLLLGAGMVVAVLAYWPGLSGPFMFDDVASIKNNQYLQVDELTPENIKHAAFSHKTGPLYRPIPIASFLLNTHFFGSDAFSFKAANLGIHLFNGLLIFILSRILLGFVLGRAAKTAGLSAALIAVLWLVHPINLTSVLYVVQRMASLSALFVLLAMIAYIKARLAWSSSQKQHALAWFSLMAAAALAGIFSKENALLLPFYFFLIEWFFLGYDYQQKQRVGNLYPAVIIWLVVPVVVGGMALLFMGTMGGYETRSFDMVERLLTQGRAIFYYIGLILLPRPGEFSLFHDDFGVSRGLFSPITTLFSVVGILGVIYWALRMHVRQPMASFGILFFFAAHLMESTFLPLELIYEHRNYLASFGLIFAVVGSVSMASANVRKKGVLVLSVFVVFFVVLTHGRAYSWQDVNRLSMTMVHNHPESSRANYQAARVFQALAKNSFISKSSKHEYQQLAIDHLLRAAETNTRKASPLLGIMLTQGMERRARERQMVANLLDGTGEKSVPLNIPSYVDKELRRRLGQEKPSLLDSGLLKQLSECERRKDCVFESGKIDELLGIFMNNPGLGEKTVHKAKLLEEFALRAYEQGDMQKAQGLIAQAVDIAPNYGLIRINGAVIMASGGDYERAMEYIQGILSVPLPDPIRAMAEKVLKGVEERKARAERLNETKEKPAIESKG
ncbi:MAG TPA: hypothetical protein ENG92_02015 [Thiolapillus brandeum]|uniref:Tetratricopeptide repeat protein n=1 Tax=Thiolapillus brandeum TaxID=1076588 RepID=A0A831NT99_9GAMM|nr:hypothetical protein [Thiolapillus brandeum]